jgi:hypothetical protein
VVAGLLGYEVAGSGEPPVNLETNNPAILLSTVSVVTGLAVTGLLRERRSATQQLRNPATPA